MPIGSEKKGVLYVRYSRVKHLEKEVKRLEEDFARLQKAFDELAAKKDLGQSKETYEPSYYGHN